MRRAFWASLFVAVVGPQQPSISGEWKFDPLATRCAPGVGCSYQTGGSRVVCGESLSIEIAAGSVTIQRHINKKNVKLSFPIDGSPIRHEETVCRDLPADPEKAALLQREIDALNALVEPGSGDMTTRATREGAVIVLRTDYATATERGTPPQLTIQETQRISLDATGHLAVETDRTANNGKNDIKSKTRVVYSRVGGKGN